MPTSTDSDLAGELAERVRDAAARKTPLRIVGGDTKAFYGRTIEAEPLFVAGHRGVIAYEPSELVITARAGTPVVEIEALLAGQGQMLGFEPPILGEAGTIGGAVAAGLSGPRRPFAGAVRDFVLGVTVLDGRGRSLRFGGTVFKNVAGFDGFRLMAGALGCLGLLLDVSLRLAPRPRAERTLRFAEDWPEASRRIGALMHRPSPLSGAVHNDGRLRLRLSGPENAVAEAARDLGGDDASPDIWADMRRMTHGALAAPRLWRLSVPRTAELSPLVGRQVIDWAGSQRWLITDEDAEIVRAAATAAGGHASLFRGAAPGEMVFAPLAEPVMGLHQRLKAVFDPSGILNPGRMYEGL